MILLPDSQGQTFLIYGRADFTFADAEPSYALYREPPMSDQLNAYRDFFRTHNVDGTSADFPLPSPELSPFNWIVMFADAVENSGPVNEKQLRYLEQIRRAARELLRIVRVQRSMP